MKYILCEKIALRSWIGTPYAYYHMEDDIAGRLTKEEFEILLLCDGTREIQESMLSEMLRRKGLIRIAAEGEELTEWQKHRRYENRYFPKANWMITGKCNFNCLHCFNALDNARLQSEFSMEEAEKLLNQMQACGIHSLTITGGEPMMHPHFMEILKGIYRRSMHVFELNTNGHFLTQEILDEMKRIGCRPLMKISFDGVGYHDWLRGKEGAEGDALRAIKLCKKNGFRVMAQTNVHRKNAHSMFETAKLLDQLGVDAMRIIRTTEAPRWMKNARDACLSIEEYFDTMTELCRAYVNTDCKMDLVLWQFVTLQPAKKEYTLATVNCAEGEYRDQRPVCGGNRGMIAIGANGNVYPCFQMSTYYEQEKEYLGNVKKDSLQSLLREGNYLREVCATVGELKEKNKECGACRFFSYCAGGCRALALACTWDKWGRDHFRCAFFHQGYIEKVAQAMPNYTCTTEIAQCFESDRKRNEV